MMDRLTVSLYRMGLSIFSLGILLRAVEALSSSILLGDGFFAVIVVGAALASANIHLYDPTFRWLVPATSWLGVIVLAVAWSAAAPNLEHVSVGFFFASMGMMAVKEQFCFKIPGLMLVPFLLLAAWVLMALDLDRLAGFPLLVAGILYLIMVIAKWRMPLHFDIGDKSYYRF